MPVINEWGDQVNAFNQSINQSINSVTKDQGNSFMQLSIISCRDLKAEIVLVVMWPWKHETHASNYLSERIHETISQWAETV